METGRQRDGAVLERLKALHPKRIDLSLGRIRRLLAALDRPETRLPPVVHVAGTNGKGSVIAMLRAGLRAAGYRVHAYTSPHLVDFRERIGLADGYGATLPIDEVELDEILMACEAANDSAPVTFFEITTAAAFLAFSRHPADVLLLEVGLGGRLDATNVVEAPVATVVTPVSIDHTQFLGTDLGGIAAEKAGILKKGVPAVIGPQEDAALAPIVARAAEVGAPLLRRGSEWDFRVDEGDRSISLRLGSRDTRLPGPSLPGPHQLANAATAAVTLLSLPGFGIGDDSVRRGLRAARWPGRLQRIERGPLRDLLPGASELWLDGGHNAAAGRALARALAAWRDEETAVRPVHLVCGMLDTKDVSAFLAPFAENRLVESVHGAPIPGETASLSGEDVAAAARKAGLDATAADTVERAIESVAGTGGRTPSRVLICGSLYLAGRILAQHG